VSNKGMRPLSGKQKTLVVIGILLAPFVAIHIQEMIFRHRAEQLLADMRSLMMRKANLAEVQGVFNRWNHSDYRCPGSDCWLEVYLTNITWEVDSHDFAGNLRKAWSYLFTMLGGRRASVRVLAVGANGVVWLIRYVVEMETSAGQDVKEGDIGGTLSGEAAYTARFYIFDDWRGLTLHSNYLIDEATTSRNWNPHRAANVYAVFGPDADAADIARLMNFDLTCLTRWMPCREPRDLMPEAVAQEAKEELRLVPARKDHVCGPDIVGLMARDALYAVVIEVVGNGTEHLTGRGQIPTVTVRVIENLEPAGLLKSGEPAGHSEIGQIFNLEILDANTDRIATSLPPDLHPSNQYILLAESGEGYRAIRAERCGIVPLNPANLELVKQAIAGNRPAAKPEPSLRSATDSGNESSRTSSATQRH